MSATAERPLIGKDLDTECAPATPDAPVNAFHEPCELRAPARNMSYAFRLEPQNDDDPDFDDGPVIKRVREPISRPRHKSEHDTAAAKCTPRLFPQHLDDDEFEAPSRDRTVPAMQDNLLGDPRMDERISRERAVNFSVAAIRQQRMKRPTHAYRATSMATKFVAAVSLGVLCVTSGVTLGLYGPEIGYHAERQARIATASLAGLLPGWSSPDSSENATSNQPVAQIDPPNNVAEASAGGKKLFYDRIAPSASGEAAKPFSATNRADSSQQPQMTSLDQLLAVPTDMTLPEPTTVGAAQ